MEGFEYDGTFYPWHVSDMGKDLILIDRFSNMPLWEFFETVDDGFDRGRAPILLTLIATSIRFGHPDWSVERIVRTVHNLSLGDVHMIDDEEQEEDPRPPASTETAPTGVGSVLPLKSTSSDLDGATSETSSGTPV